MQAPTLLIAFLYIAMGPDTGVEFTSREIEEIRPELIAVALALQTAPRYIELGDARWVNGHRLLGDLQNTFEELWDAPPATDKNRIHYTKTDLDNLIDINQKLLTQLYFVRDNFPQHLDLTDIMIHENHRCGYMLHYAREARYGFGGTEGVRRNLKCLRELLEDAYYDELWLYAVPTWRMPIQ